MIISEKSKKRIAKRLQELYRKALTSERRWLFAEFYVAGKTNNEIDIDIGNYNFYKNDYEAQFAKISSKYISAFNPFSVYIVKCETDEDIKQDIPKILTQMENFFKEI